MHGIEVMETGEGMLIELSGELDLCSLTELRKTLGGVASLGMPTVVDLSAVTFLDLISARELAVRAEIHAQNLALRNPSREATASFSASRVDGRLRFGDDIGDPIYPVPK